MKIIKGDYSYCVKDNCNNTVAQFTDESDALLFTKSKDMLRMLNKVVEMQDKYFGDGVKTHLALKKISVDIEELIQKATTI